MIKPNITLQELLKQFKEKNSEKLFTYPEALRGGISKAHFYKFVANGVFKRVQRNYYCLNGYAPLSLEDQFRDASLLVNSKSAICLLSALSYYELSDRIVSPHFLLVDSTVVKQTDLVNLFRKREPKWRVGIEKKHGFFITSLERTIVECLVFKRWTGNEGVQAFRKAIFDSQTRIWKVYEMAKKLGYLKRIEKKLEVFF